MESQSRSSGRVATTVARRRGLRAAAIFALAFGLTTTGTCLAQRHNVFSPAALVPPPGDGWRTNGGNIYNQRYSPLAAIDRGNVAQLKGVWRVRLNGSGLAPQYSGEAQPLVHDGVIYLVTGANDVFALSVETGAILWQHSASLDPKITSVCCGWTNRGVALGGGKVFYGQQIGRAHV